jgi:hypothetical protein
MQEIGRQTGNSVPSSRKGVIVRVLDLRLAGMHRRIQNKQIIRTLPTSYVERYYILGKPAISLHYLPYNRPGCGYR